MNIGWDVVDIPPVKDGTFEFVSRWLRAVGAYPAGHHHICYANAAFQRAAAPAAPDAVEWRIAGNWTRAYQLQREAYFWRHGRTIAREVEVLLSVHRPPLAWRGKSIAILLDCTRELFPAARGWKSHLTSELRYYGARRAGRWLAISEWTRRDAIRLRGYPAGRVRAAGIPLAGLAALPAGPESAAPEVRELAGRRYAFYCSAISSRKNHTRLIRAWQRAFPDREVLLVLAGRELPHVSVGIRAAIQQAERDGFVHALGLISDTVREQLYAGADFVVYPSLYEGFGMPVLEALRYAKPVLTSAGTSMEEVGGDAVLLCDPQSEDDLVENLRRIATDEALRTRLRGRIPAVLERYLPENVARQLHAGIEYLAGLPPAP